MERGVGPQRTAPSIQAALRLNLPNRATLRGYASADFFRRLRCADVNCWRYDPEERASRAHHREYRRMESGSVDIIGWPPALESTFTDAALGSSCGCDRCR